MNRLFLCVAVMFVPLAAVAQPLPATPSGATTVCVAATTRPGEMAAIDVSELTREYTSGHWNDVVKRIADVLRRPPVACPDGTVSAVPVDPVRDYLHVLWTGSVPAATDPTVFSALVHTPSLTPFSRVVPGLAGTSRPLYEVHVSANLSANAESYYLSKPLKNPLLEQVPSVIERFAGPLFALVDRVDPRYLPNMVDAPSRVVPASLPKLAITIKRVDLPEARADVEVAVRVVEPITAADFSTRVATTETRIGSESFAAARPLVNSRIAVALRTEWRDGVCGKPETKAARCKQALHAAVTSIVLGERPQVPADPALRELDALEAAWRRFVDGLAPTVVTGKLAIENSPLTKMSFGLLSSVLIGQIGRADVRAKVEGGKIVASPQPRALQAVTLNLVPWGYQAKTARRWQGWRATFQPFVGVAVAPDLGVTAGLSLRVLNNLGLNVGAVYLWTTRPEDGLALGDALDEKVKDESGKDTSQFKWSDDLRRDPLRPGRSVAWFAGLSYNFK